MTSSIDSNDSAETEGTNSTATTVSMITKSPVKSPAVDIGRAPANLFASLLSGPLITITVGNGNDTRSWTLHRNLLAHHSPILAARFESKPPSAPKLSKHPALPPAIKEKDQDDDPGNQLAARPKVEAPPGASRDSQTISLPETSPDAFALLVKWLYQGSIAPAASLPQDEIWPYAFLCQQLHALAARFGLPRLQNAAMDEFRHGCNAAYLVPGADEMTLAYRSEEPGSEMRKLISAIAARQLLDPDSERGARSYRQCFEDPEFSVDVVDAIRAGMGGLLLADPTEERGCMYHVHAEGEQCDAMREGGRKGGNGGRIGGNGILKKKVTFKK